MAKVEVGYKTIKTVVDSWKNIVGYDVKHKELYGSYIFKSGIKMSATLHLYETRDSEHEYIYYLMMEGNEYFSFTGTTKAELYEDMKMFKGVTNSEKNYWINEWGMEEETYEQWIEA